jgi:hypothetical protein
MLGISYKGIASRAENTPLPPGILDKESTMPANTHFRPDPDRLESKEPAVVGRGLGFQSDQSVRD